MAVEGAIPWLWDVLESAGKLRLVRKDEPLGGACVRLSAATCGLCKPQKL